MSEHLKATDPIGQLREVMARLRAPDGCPWDREQDHHTIRFHAVEEVYEMIDAIEAGDDRELKEELGDLLLQVIFHAQLAMERKAFDFDDVAAGIVEKLIRRHPHVFGNNSDADNTEKVLTQWEAIKKAEKEGTEHQRDSVLDGIPRHLPALSRSEKLVKKARKAGLIPRDYTGPLPSMTQDEIASRLFELTSLAQASGWSAEALLRKKTDRAEEELRRLESESVSRSAADADRR